jgi:hypothetical protein
MHFLEKFVLMAMVLSLAQLSSSVGYFQHNSLNLVVGHGTNRKLTPKQLSCGIVL